MRNDASQSAIIPELSRILEQVKEKGDKEVEGFYWYWDIQEFTLKVPVPRVEGQNMQVFQDWDWRTQNWRKMWHMEMEASMVKIMQELITVTKEFGIINSFWGLHMRVVLVLEKSGVRGVTQRLTSQSMTCQRWHLTVKSTSTTRQT